MVLKQIAGLYGAGKLQQAHQLCLQVLKQRPKLADAHSMMGVILSGLGRNDEARKAIKNAIRFNPTSHYYSNLASWNAKWQA